MRIIEKLAARARDNQGAPGVTIAFLGDSVTQGCFEVYVKNDGDIEAVYDPRHAYHRQVQDILAVLYPSVPVNIINAGISGDNATAALKRVQRDVIQHKPDLTVVCFGLNDCGAGDAGLPVYIDSLTRLFRALREDGSELVFMTPNMMATEVSCHIPQGLVRDIAASIANSQVTGVLDRYLDAARALCEQENVPVCDCYRKWQMMHQGGVNTTDLLSNYINHPTREMNWLFAYSLVETFFTAQANLCQL